MVRCLPGIQERHKYNATGSHPGASQQRILRMTLRSDGNRILHATPAWMLVCILNMVTRDCEAQVNLVPNPSFEEADTCAAQMGYLTNGRPLHWFSFSDTPDYYRSCVPEGAINWVPQSGVVYQYPYDGGSFSGLFTYAYGNNYREMIGAELLTPLEVGVTYYASMWVNAGTGGNAVGNLGICSNNIGMLFTMDPYFWVSGMQSFGLRNYAHVFHPEVVMDTVEWTLVSGSFVADSAYRYIVIGNHFTDENTLLDTIAIGYYNRAYMPVDAICVSVHPDGCPLATGVQQPKTLLPQMFPNPASGQVHVTGLLKGYRDVRVYDPLGRLVWSGSTIGLEQLALDVSTWPMGQFVLVLQGLRGRHSIRFVVMR